MAVVVVMVVAVGQNVEAIQILNILLIQDIHNMMLPWRKDIEKDVVWGRDFLVMVKNLPMAVTKDRLVLFTIIPLLLHNIILTNSLLPPPPPPLDVIGNILHPLRNMNA